ncbi:tyrosine-type recombinase/integrase [Pedobacter sp. LMG 31464]|uniref:Tyrosine-type recombinase/integrase n=1 Tax=Pedobacter planticolens TaxID=2679964 RepID=A0A923IVA7_9SPHI|nr:phage integrase SAM-like domain-containing protein [Pedobacter planticolens]MBB2146850.1 tyrosine-type recombinase/integrase [Pedobacter planticolens]
MKKASISIYHDTRRALDDGRFPIKLRVYFGKAKMYETGLSASVEDFEKAYINPSPRGRFRELLLKIKAIESKAMEAIEFVRSFTFAKFEKALFRNKPMSNNVIEYYKDYISELQCLDRIGTASSYKCSLSSILRYVNQGRKKGVEKLGFDVITPEFLHKYERWALEMNMSRSSIGIYLRPLRKLFNTAIANGDIDPDVYPFKKYRIPTGKNIKKNIEKDVLKLLYTMEVQDENIIKARDFWFFSYQCNGMNFRDIAELRCKNLTDTYFSFLRHKTLNTTKEDPTPIVVPITAGVERIIAKYGKRDGDDNDYVFPILQQGMPPEERHRANQNFIRYVNQHMRKLAKMAGLSFNLGTMYARHSFTTIVAREVGLEFAQEALGHTTLATTQKYWAGFESKIKKEVAEKLLDFI